MDKIFKRSLRNVYEQKDYQTLLDFKDEMLRRWNNDNVIGSSEFDTMALTFSREFKKVGLITFFEELEKEISQDD